MYKNLNKKYSPGVFMLARKTENSVEFLGTGFLVSSQGHVLTCSHVINPLDKIVAISIGTVNTFNPMTLSQVQYNDLILVQNDAIYDVALLKFAQDIGFTVPVNIFGDTNKLENGSSIATIGFPFANNGLHIQSITHGIISSKTVTPSGIKLLQFDTMIHEGNSGSPLLDLQTNQIVGIVTNRFNPTGGGGASVMLGNRQLGVETNISYAAVIEYGKELLNSEIN